MSLPGVPRRSVALSREDFGGIQFWLSSRHPRPGRPTVVLLHGLGNSLDYWTAVAPILADTTQVIAIDIPGFGKSRRPAAGFGLAAICDEINDLLEYLKPHDVLLVGHSLGSYIALGLAKCGRFPIRSVMLVSAALFRAERALRDLPFALHSRALSVAVVAQFVGGSIPFSPSRASLLARSEWSRRATLWPFVADPESLDASLVASALAGNAGRSVLATLLLAKAVSLQELAGSVSVPASLVWGNRDRLINEDDIAVARALFRPRRELCVEDCGHWPMIEKPHALAEFIRREVEENDL